MENKKLTFREEWYFARQDVVSYTISSVLYLLLNLFQKLDFQTFLYSSFECLVFYTSFWFIRVNFDLTYHSDNWKTCKMWTRIMLCVGVILLWFMPIKYTLLNGLLVAFICALVLYLIEFYRTAKSIYAMSENELYEHCRNKGLSHEECMIANIIVYKRLKGKDFYSAIGYSERQSKRIRKKILEAIQ